MGYGFGGFGQPNPYGYMAGGYYPNYYNNGGGGGAFYGSPFGQQVDSPHQKAQKDANHGFFTKLFSRFSDSNSPAKQQQHPQNKLMTPPHPFDMNATNFYNPYQLGHMDFGKLQKQK